jgi:hypothetical protein
MYKFKKSNVKKFGEFVASKKWKRNKPIHLSVKL